MKQKKIIIFRTNDKKEKYKDLHFKYRGRLCSVYHLVGTQDNSTCPGMFVLLMWGNSKDPWGWIVSQPYWADEGQDFSEGSNLLEQDFAKQALADLDVLLAIKDYGAKGYADVQS